MDPVNGESQFHLGTTALHMLLLSNYYGDLLTFYLGKCMQFMHCRWRLGSLKEG